jgi:FMN phosphatase YigB (HAD superfamily)
MIFLFDCFGTVFNMQDIPKEDLRYYGSVLKKPVWEPLEFPPHWRNIPPHPDSKEGLERLKRNGHKVVALSNAPLPLMCILSANAGIEWSHIIPLEKYKIYKPNPLAYLTACAELKCRPGECVMVTANEKFGDLEGSASVGMFPQLIRHPDPSLDINWLADVFPKLR